MKFFKKTAAITLCLAMLFGIAAVKTSAQEIDREEDCNSPRCILSITPKIGLSETGSGVIRISDESPLKDSEITSEDIIVRSNHTGQIAITSVYKEQEYYDEQYQSYELVYRFQFKGTVLGGTDVYIDAAAVSDEAGNVNWPSQTQSVYVTLFPVYKSSFYFFDVFDFISKAGEYIFLLLSQIFLLPFNFLFRI